MMNLEDSPDLTDDQVAAAVPAADPEDVRAHLAGARCECGSPLLVQKHLLRRRAPHHYWRVHLRCASQEHEVTVVYRTDWLVR